MTIRLSQLSTVWGADDAKLVLELLDELRDALWETYGEQIVQQRHAEQARYAKTNTAQLDLWENDNDPGL